MIFNPSEVTFEVFVDLLMGILFKMYLFLELLDDLTEFY